MDLLAFATSRMRTYQIVHSKDFCKPCIASQIRSMSLGRLRFAIVSLTKLDRYSGDMLTRELTKIYSSRIIFERLSQVFFFLSIPNFSRFELHNKAELTRLDKSGQARERRQVDETPSSALPPQSAATDRITSSIKRTDR